MESGEIDGEITHKVLVLEFLEFSKIYKKILTFNEELLKLTV